jgi:hypothetical protein
MLRATYAVCFAPMFAHVLRIVNLFVTLEFQRMLMCCVAALLDDCPCEKCSSHAPVKQGDHTVAVDKAREHAHVRAS